MNESNRNWISIKIPRILRTEFEKYESSFPNFAQFAQYAIRRQIEKLEAAETSRKTEVEA